jgi:GntR family transcriptional regulator/MocR family aminotransferase
VQLALEINLSGAPLQAQIFKEVRNLIESGRLRPGTCMPSTRALSEQLSVSRNTIILAYEALTAEGYLQSQQGAGTYVSHALPETSTSSDAGLDRNPAVLRPIELFIPVAESSKRSNSAREIVWDFALERTDPASFPQNAWRRLTSWRMRSPKFNLTHLGTPKGLRELRETLVGYLGAARGIACSPEQILIVTGIQQALNVAAHLFVRAGTTIAMEAPGCSQQRSLAPTAQKSCPFPSTRMASLQSICRNRRPISHS